MAPRLSFDLIIGDSYPPGDSARYNVKYSTGPDQNTLTPADLTTATIEASLSETKGGPSVVDFETVKANQGTNPGEFTWRIPASESIGLTPRRHYLRIALAWAGTSSETTLLEGLVEVRNAL